MTTHNAEEPHLKEPEANVILMPQAPIIPAVLTIEQAAVYIGVSKATLHDWRCKRPGFGPVSTRLGTRLAYQQKDLDAWLEKQREVIELSEAEAEGMLAPDATKPADSMTRRRRMPGRLAG